MQVYPRIK